MIFAYDEDRVLFASNYYEIDVELLGDRYYGNPTEENLPCWHPYKGMLAYVDSLNCRITDLIRYCVTIPEELSFETLEILYQDIIDVLKKNRFKTNESRDFTLYIADSDTVYMLTRLGIVFRESRNKKISGKCLDALSHKIPDGLSAEERVKEYYRLENGFYRRQNIPILTFRPDEDGVRIVEL